MQFLSRLHQQHTSKVSRTSKGIKKCSPKRPLLGRDESQLLPLNQNLPCWNQVDEDYEEKGDNDILLLIHQFEKLNFEEQPLLDDEEGILNLFCRLAIHDCQSSEQVEIFQYFGNTPCTIEFE